MLKMNQSEYDEIRRQGEEAYPEEGCGVLLGIVSGDTRTVQATVQCANAECDSLRTRYSIEPRELVSIQRAARERALEIVGFYHSHPDHPARWSETDFAEAHWIGCSYVITEVREGRAMLTRSFALTGHTEEDKLFVDEEILVE
jgi:proteasome lid subunit RPN8/RPN11